jgi:hypothetical protein
LPRSTPRPSGNTPGVLKRVWWSATGFSMGDTVR